MATTRDAFHQPLESMAPSVKFGIGRHIALLGVAQHC